MIISLYRARGGLTIEDKYEAFIVVARHLKALADPTRLAIIHTLCEGGRNVTSIIEITGFSQARVSKHLRILREEKVVASRRQQRNVNYSLTSNLPRRICELACESIRCAVDNEADSVQRLHWNEPDRLK